MLADCSRWRDTKDSPERLHARAATALLANMSRYDASSSLSTPPLRRRVARRSVRAVSDEESWEWAKSHRGRGGVSPPPGAGRAAGKAIRTLSARFGPGLSELDEHWPVIVGDALARYTRPEKFQGGSAGLTLVVRAQGPAAALTEAQAPQILDRVARYAGRKPKKLKIVQGPIAAQAAPARARKRRITRVDALTPEPRGLKAVLDAFEAAVRAREYGAPDPHTSNNPPFKEQD